MEYLPCYGAYYIVTGRLYKHGLFTLLRSIVFVQGDNKTWTIYLVMEYSICTWRL